MYTLGTLITLLMIPMTTIAMNKLRYIPYTQLHPGQHSFTSKEVAEKIAKALEKGHAAYNEQTAAYTFSHHEGQSIFSSNDALPVVKKSDDCYLLVDGHHSVLASIKLGAKMICVKIINDLSKHKEHAFWEEAEQKGYAYLYPVDGEPRIPPYRFKDMVDDPYRWLPHLLKGLVPADGDLKQYSGPKYPVWIKCGKGVPFIEFAIARALRKGGISFSYSTQLSDAMVEDCRKILLEATICGLRVVPTRTLFSKLICVPEACE